VAAERDSPENASLVKIFGSGFDAICDETWSLGTFDSSVFVFVAVVRDCKIQEICKCVEKYLRRPP
jgi:hypothetical protein